MSPIQLQLLSDLHLESPKANDIFQINPTAPYRALLGDIGCMKDAEYLSFLTTQLSQFRVVFLVLGCTLFSDITTEQKESVSFGINDFYYIEGWNVELHNEAHVSDLDWLNSQVKEIEEKESDREIVILTHYSPTLCSEAVDSVHAKSRISSGFASDLRAEVCGEVRG